MVGFKKQVKWTKGWGIPVYYDPQQPLIDSMLSWRNTVIKLVFRRPEFWVYLCFHAGLCCIIILKDVEAFNVNLEAAGALQYFVTFFITLYNDHCFTRYTNLYPACCDLLDAVVLFAHELTISLHHREVHAHRMQAVRFVVASCYLFFMSITGGTCTGKEWAEVVKKGLLTKPEARMLMAYPGTEVHMVLTAWGLHVVTDALQQDCMWQERSQRIAHIHNRMHRQIYELHHAFKDIAHVMALPIPFPYYHLMNVIFVLNFLVLAIILAGFKSWMTIIPYTMVLLIFMGLREVSNALADPFGEDGLDFPVAKYIDYCFDHSFALLLAFSHPDAYERTRAAIKSVHDFTDEELKRQVEAPVIYKKTFRAHIENPYAWDKDMPLQKIDRSESPLTTLSESLARHVGDAEKAERELSSVDEGSGSEFGDIVSTHGRHTKSQMKRRIHDLHEEVKDLRLKKAVAEEAEAEYRARSRPLDRPDRDRGRNAMRRQSFQFGGGGSEQGSRAASEASLDSGGAEGGTVTKRSFDDARRHIRRTLLQSASENELPQADSTQPNQS